MTESCHICGSASLAELPRYSGLPRITSDCKPWRGGGRLAVCGTCGAVQAVLDESWREDVGRIYGSYEIYHQTGGAEQAIFDARGTPVARSARLVERLVAELQLPQQARLLDVGCGRGHLLRSVAAARPGWSLVGYEISDRFRDEVESIPQVERLATGDVADIAGRFDVITLVHALEHIPEPVEILRRVAEKLSPGGVVVVEVPNMAENPLDLVVADHCTHFTLPTLVSVAERAGLTATVATDQWLPKELTLVARPDSNATVDGIDIDIEEAAARTSLAWLEALLARAEAIAAGTGSVGVFGTSLAGTWVYAGIGSRVAFFVDESPTAAGQEHLGLKVRSPRDVPESAPVYLALPPAIADNVWSRLRELPAPGVWYLPPELRPRPAGVAQLLDTER